MTPSELEAYLHAHIPLTRAMAVSAVSIGDEGVVLAAPLAPNINHRDTVFGGSASALAILAAWSLVHLKLSGEATGYRLVIQRNTMSYEAPIAGDFSARAYLPQGTDWDRFVAALARRGRARIAAVSELIFDGNVAGRLEADFVALSDQRPS